MLSAWTIQEEKFCCQSAQKTAIKGTGINTFPIILSVSLLKISAAYFFIPTGGMWTNFLRPAQKKSVAIAMKTPGKPKAMSGLCNRGLSKKPAIEGEEALKLSDAVYGSSNHGISSVEMNEPALIEK